MSRSTRAQFYCPRGRARCGVCSETRAHRRRHLAKRWRTRGFVEIEDWMDNDTASESADEAVLPTEIMPVEDVWVG